MTLIYFFVGWWLIGIATVVCAVAVDVAVDKEEMTATNGDAVKGAAVTLMGPVLTLILVCGLLSELPHTAWWNRVIRPRKVPKP